MGRDVPGYLTSGKLDEDNGPIRHLLWVVVDTCLQANRGSQAHRGVNCFIPHVISPQLVGFFDQPKQDAQAGLIQFCLVVVAAAVVTH